MSITNETNWKMIALGEACDVNPSRPKLVGSPHDTPVLFVPMAAVDEVTGTVSRARIRALGELRAKSYRTFSPGDVIFAKITPCMENGKSAVVPEISSGLGFGSTEFHVLRPKQGVNRRYIWHFVRQRSFRREAEEHMTGSVGQLRVPAAFLESSQIPMPNETMQTKIVNLLDKAVHTSRQAANHLASSRLAVERFRQAVLAAACSGRLTADWREEHGESASIKKLLDHIDSLRQNQRPAPVADWPADTPESWAMVSLDRLIAVVTSGSRGWAKYYAVDGPMFIRAQNINTDRLDLSDVAHVRPPGGSEGKRTKVRKDDLLVTITGANVTKAALVDREIGEAYINQHVALARAMLSEMAGYLHLWTISPNHGRRKLAADAYGAGKPGLNLTNLRTMPVAVPPLEEQFEIVTRVKALFALVDGVETRAMAAARVVERSSQAVLARAFRGDLIANAESHTNHPARRE